MLFAIFFALTFSFSTINGTVRVEGSREPVPYAVVQIPELRRSTVADERGYFALPSIPAGSYTVRATAPGFLPRERRVQVSSEGTTAVEFTLPQRAVALDPIEVRGRASEPAAAVGPGPARLDASVVELVPALAEADVLRTLQTLPSVQASSDFSSALYVRGGSPDQNLILLDGAPLFNPFHLGGVFAAVDPDAIATMDVYAGAFPARLGGRLSSIVELWTRDGGRDRIRSQGSVGLISARASVDGPLPGGDGSFLLSARRTYLDLFTDAAAAVGLIEKPLPYGFTDAHLKLTHDVGKLGRVSASFYTDDEELLDYAERPGERDDRFAWGSRAASLHYRQPIGGSLLATFRAAYSSFGSTVDFFEGAGAAEFRTIDSDAKLRDVLAAAELTWYRRTHEVRAGIQADWYRFDYDVRREPVGFFAELFPEFRRTDRLQTTEAFLEDEWRPTDALGLRVGVRVLHAGEVGTEVLPRIGARYALTPQLALTVGAGRYAQALHSLRDEESLAASYLAYDLLVAANRELGLATGEDLVLGAEWANAGTSVRVDGYAKRLHNLALPPLPSEPFEAPVLVADGFRAGEGSAQGLELLARHETGWGGIQASYALSSADREVAGERFTPRFHRRHVLDALAFRTLGERGRLTARLVLGSGQPYTPVVGAFQPLEYDPAQGAFTRDFRGSFLLGEPNSERLPGYWRLDVGARRSYTRRWFGRPTTITPFAQIVNVLNTRNVLIAEPTFFGETGGNELEFQPQLPFLPTFGVEWKF